MGVTVPDGVFAAIRRPTWRALLGVAGAVTIIVVLVIVLTSGSQPALPLPGLRRPARAGDPFGYISARRAAFERRAVAGSEQVLFVKSPGGVVATAARV